MPIRLGIECYTGHPGSGKTYSMVRRAFKLCSSRAYKYHTIYSNMKLNVDYMRGKTGWRGDFIYLTDFEQLYYINNGLLLLDELNIWSPSALWQEAPREMLAGWAQVRKSELCILVTTQSFNRIYKVVREITHSLYKMSSLRSFKYFLAICHDVEDGVISKNKVPNFIKIKKEVYNSYDTNEKIIMPGIYITEKTAAQIEREKKLIESVKARTKAEICESEECLMKIAAEKIRLKKLLHSGIINRPVMGANGFQEVNKIYNKYDEVTPDIKRLDEFQKTTIKYEPEPNFKDLFSNTG